MKSRIMLSVMAVFIIMTISGCGHEHVWDSATCTKPQTCKECGETQGEPLGHNWIEATCSDPKKCSVCGITEGEPLGHDTEFGVCSRCGTEIGGEELEKITSYIDIINANSTSAFNDIADADTSSIEAYYSDLSSAAAKFKNDEPNLKKIIELCGDRKEFSSLKNYAQKAIDAIPEGPAGSDMQSLQQFTDDALTYLHKLVDVLEEEKSLYEKHIESMEKAVNQ